MQSILTHTRGAFLRLLHLNSTGNVPDWAGADQEPLYLRAFTVAFTPIIALILLIRVLLAVDAYEARIVLIIATPVLLVFVMAAFLSNTRFYTLGSVLIVMTISIVSLGGSIYFDMPSILTFISVSSLLSTVFMALPLALLVNTINLVFVIIAAYYTTYDPVETANIFTLTIAMFLLSATVSWLRGKYNQRLQHQTKMIIAAQRQELQLQARVKQSEMAQRFMRDIAHELRTPLSVISTSLYLLQKADDTRRQEIVDKLKKQTGHLAQVMEAFADLTSIQETRDVSFRFVSVNSFLRMIQSGSQAKAEAKQVQFDMQFYTDDLKIFANEKLLYRALSAVVNNAIQHTPSGGRVTVSSTRTPTQCQITVVDTGIGIAADDLPHVYDAFYKADTARTASAEQGPGIGLSLAKEIVALHDGSIQIDSTPGQGTTVTMTLPLAKPA